MSDELTLKLANKIEEKLKKDFDVIHLSGNLANTIKIEKTDNGYSVQIPARVYDLVKWRTNRVIVYTGTDSYAEAVDQNGGFSGKHKKYVERAIMESIDEWINENKLVVSIE